MKKLLGKVKADMAIETLGVALATYGIAQFSVAVSLICLGVFLVVLVEMAN